MNKHEQARKDLTALNDKIDKNAFQNEYGSLDNYINEAEATEKELKSYKDEVEELMELVIGNYDMTRLEEDMKVLDGNDLRIAKLIIKLSRSDEK